jgi:hypothetical protein
MKNMVVLPHQSQYMQAPGLFPEVSWFFLCCGYGAGKTRANVIALLYDVKRLQGKKDRAGDHVRLMVCGTTLSHLEKTFLIYLRQYLITSKTPYTENKKYNTFKIGTVIVILQPLENPGDIYGMDVHKIYVEEADELTTDKMLEATKALNERCRQVIIGERSPCVCFGSTSQGQKGLYAVYNHFKKSGVGFVLIRGRTEDNPFLPKRLVRDMLKMYTPEEREVFMHGKFMAIAKGRVLPGFDWERNYASYDLDTDVKPDETILWGQDINSGYNRGSAYIIRDGVLYAIKYYDFQNLLDAPKVVRHDFPVQKILWLPDVTIKDSFPMFAKELRKYNITIIYRKKSPNVEDSCFLVSKLFYLNRLIVCKIAGTLAEACATAQRDKNNQIPKGVGPSSPIHAIDGLRYVATFVVVKYPDFAGIRQLIADKRASLRGEQDKEALVKKIGAGYTEINPEAFVTSAFNDR